jgi:menaquinone-dependent protoporphyrinogen oxidase
MRALVAYGTKHGSTREIAEAIAAELREAGMTVDCLEASTVKAVSVYDLVVLGSAVYMKRWRAEARRLLKRHRRELAAMPFWIFSSGAVGEKPAPPKWSEPAAVTRLSERIGVREHVVFGGRVPQDPGNFVERAMLKNTPAEYQDLRDWDEIREWAARIAASVMLFESDAGDRDGQPDEALRNGPRDSGRIAIG